jgi:hypothetical protein
MSGVEVPENMLRCVNNNATILGFWKGWHASYNRRGGVNLSTYQLSLTALVCHQRRNSMT